MTNVAPKTLNIALIGQAFMGRAHSNAWGQVNRFCKAPFKTVLHTVCASRSKTLAEFAGKWGWQNFSTDWQAVCKNPAIDLVDIGTPNYLHMPMALEALEAGKHVACEKPLAGTLTDARKMMEAAKNSAGKTFVWYNYRRCPAVAFAHQLVKSGKLGAIRHVRACYLQSWGDESVPLAWRFDKKLAGSGAHGDLNAHIVDMARFVTGEEITEICGAIAETFVKERSLLEGAAAGGIADGLRSQSAKGEVTVDDCVLFLARFQNGAVASFEAARQATGNFNRHGFEINGTKGALRFNFEDMNSLEFFDATAPRSVQGWTRVFCTNAGSHPYIEFWWPDVHIIGYEHSFTNQAYDILLALDGKEPVVPLPDFADAYETQRVLEAALCAAEERRWVGLSEVF